jgi:hypothetical protein
MYILYIYARKTNGAFRVCLSVLPMGMVCGHMVMATQGNKRMRTREELGQGPSDGNSRWGLGSRQGRESRMGEVARKRLPNSSTLMYALQKFHKTLVGACIKISLHKKIKAPYKKFFRNYFQMKPPADFALPRLQREIIVEPIPVSLCACS